MRAIRRSVGPRMRNPFAAGVPLFLLSACAAHPGAGLVVASVPSEPVVPTETEEVTSTDEVAATEAVAPVEEVAVGPLAPAVPAICAGMAHVCALGADHRVRCFGDGTEGQLGFNPTPPADDPRARDLALLEDGRPRLVLPDAAVLVPGVDTAVRLRCGPQRTCVVLANGNLSCWGLVVGEAPVLHSPDGRFRTLPVAADRQDRIESSTDAQPVSDAIDVVAGRTFTCVLHRDGHVSCWGRRFFAFDPPFMDSAEPVRVEGLEDIVAIAGPYSTSCALRGDGRVLCWGEGSGGDLGDGLGQDSQSPVLVAGVEGAVDLSSHFDGSCAVDREGRVTCWGEHSVRVFDFDELSEEEALPHGIGRLPPVSRVFVGAWADSPSCAIGRDGRGHCWRRPINWASGAVVPRFERHARAVAIEAQYRTHGPWTSVASGEGFACALHADGRVSCAGQLPWTPEGSAPQSAMELAGIELGASPLPGLVPGPLAVSEPPLPLRSPPGCAALPSLYPRAAPGRIDRARVGRWHDGPTDGNFDDTFLVLYGDGRFCDEDGATGRWGMRGRTLVLDVHHRRGPHDGDPIESFSTPHPTTNRVRACAPRDQDERNDMESCYSCWQRGDRGMRDWMCGHGAVDEL